jgi:hypothetical protein
MQQALLRYYGNALKDLTCHTINAKDYLTVAFSFKLFTNSFMLIGFYSFVLIVNNLVRVNV